MLGLLEHCIATGIKLQQKLMLVRCNMLCKISVPGNISIKSCVKMQVRGFDDVCLCLGICSSCTLICQRINLNKYNIIVRKKSFNIYANRGMFWILQNLDIGR